MAAIVMACGTTAVIGLPVSAQPTVPPPFSTPNTDNCPDRVVPGPAIDESEDPQPGSPSPAALPVPAPPVGGETLSRCGLVLPAGAPPPPPDISAWSWVVSDLDAGTVLAAKDPHGRYRPASTIKTLLSIVALRNLDLTKTVVGTEDDANADGTRVGIGLGGVYTNRQLMQALVMCSGNDAAHALAMQLGGMDAAVQKMNNTAKSLGALDTRAASPSGLDGPGMSSSAYDLSLFFREALTIPTFGELIHTDHVDFPGFPANPKIPGDKDHPGFQISNDNVLLYNYDGIIGSKNDYTDDARQTLVGAAQRNGHRIGVSIMHADVLPIRPWEQVARLFDYGFALQAAGLPTVGQLAKPSSSSQAGADNDGVAVAAPPSASGAETHGWTTSRTVLTLGGVALVGAIGLAAARVWRRRTSPPR